MPCATPQDESLAPGVTGCPRWRLAEPFWDQHGMSSSAVRVKSWVST